MAKKILLVEHDEPTCRMLQQQLTQVGYDVVLAADGGDEGILMAVTEAPDLVLVATDLPVIDGWQAIRILKASTVTQKIPVLALMVLTADADWERMANSGCDDYELKPVDLTSVLDKIKALLESQSPVAEIATGARASFGLTNSSAQSDSLGNGVVFNEQKVVYIDDSPLDSQTMAQIIRRAGYGYENIPEPLEAIPRLLEIRPKLIFLDLVMPFTNGYEICAQIRRTSTFRKTPIIIVTNNDGIIDRVRARFVGASGFFSKPVKEDRVLKVLKKHLLPLQSETSKSVSQSGLLPFA